MINYLEFLNVPMRVCIAVVGCLLVMQLILELLEFKGKVVPEFLSIRKFFSRRKEQKREVNNTLKEVKKLLNDVNTRYSDDNIAKRNSWMKWVNDRADVYDASIVGITESLSNVTAALNANTKLTEEVFVQNSRDRIIDFSHRAADHTLAMSREEFNRIFKVYDKYEKFLEAHGLTNGEINVVYDIIKESYKWHMENHAFIEDTRGL